MFFLEDAKMMTEVTNKISLPVKQSGRVCFHTCLREQRRKKSNSSANSNGCLNFRVQAGVEVRVRL